MTTERPRTRRVRPVVARVTRFGVIDSRIVSENFVRVTLGTTDESFAADFRYLGFDQWFRLFLPQPGERALVLPLGPIDGWHTRLLGIDESVRPIVRNYTIREARRDERGWQIDVDFVVHRGATGAIDGIAAAWAATALPGDEVGLLDQGRIFNPDDCDVTGSGRYPDHILIVADESGLPGVEGIARSLPAGSRVTAVIEVPSTDEIRELTTSAALDLRWVVRLPGGQSGSAALPALADIDVSPDDYVYLVGEGGFLTEARDALCAAGATRQLIDFCAYWRRAKQPVSA
ncbi:siderophore-interacting protein [soil metagenome]